VVKATDSNCGTAIATLFLDAAPLGDITTSEVSLGIERFPISRPLSRFVCIASTSSPLLQDALVPNVALETKLNRQAIWLVNITKGLALGFVQTVSDVVIVTEFGMTPFFRHHASRDVRPRWRLAPGSTVTFTSLGGCAWIKLRFSAVAIG
jgi:hypothetical protein